MKKVAAAVLFTMASTSVFAEDLCSESTRKFEASVEAYKSSDADGFVKHLLKNGPLQADQRSLAQAKGLIKIEKFFGSIQGVSILSTREIGARTCYVIGILEYQSGPAFAVVTYYKGNDAVGVTSMFFRTEPEKILPREFLVQEK